jgi:D-amino peptidase
VGVCARAGDVEEDVRVHVISDMEGVAGVVKWEQTTGGDPMYEEARRLYTEEINAAVRGARAGGATEVVVMDCHGAGKGWTFNNLVPELLDPSCEFVVQEHWTGYTEFLEEGCDAALFVAMHAKAGDPHGVLNHTVSGRSWQNLFFNGVAVGETGINAALCGHFGCPVLLVTGDHAVCDEARALLGEGITTVAVKRGLGAFSARNLAPKRARELIEAGARGALSDLSAVAPYDPGRPCEITVEFKDTHSVEEYRRRPGVEVTEPRTIVSRADDWWSAWSQFFF